MNTVDNVLEANLFDRIVIFIELCSILYEISLIRGLQTLKELNSNLINNTYICEA